MPSGRLWIVATPIGCPGDLSPRAQDVLGKAGLILAEDTRRAGLLLREAGIQPQKMLSFFEHNEAERLPEAIAALRNGIDVALISDAGTPLLADPGYRLARECRSLGIPVSPVPGPSAPAAALSAAGLPPVPYSFLGFLPRPRSGRERLFELYARLPGSLVFFERKDRLAESLRIAYDVLGDREIAICRELTKIHEEFIMARLAQLDSLPQGLLGEITVVIGPAAEAEKMPETKARRLLENALAGGMKPKAAAKSVKEAAPGWTASELYELAISLK